MISTSGSAAPPSRSPHFSGSPSAEVSPAVLTHADPAPAASPCTALTGVASTSSLFTSMRDTVPSL